MNGVIGNDLLPRLKSWVSLTHDYKTRRQTNMKKTIFAGIISLLMLVGIVNAMPYEVMGMDEEAFSSLPETVTVMVNDGYWEPTYYGTYRDDGTVIKEYLIVPSLKVAEALNLYDSIDKSKLVFRGGYTPYLATDYSGQYWSSGIRVK